MNDEGRLTRVLLKGSEIVRTQQSTIEFYSSILSMLSIMTEENQ